MMPTDQVRAAGRVCGRLSLARPAAHPRRHLNTTPGICHEPARIEHGRNLDKLGGRKHLEQSWRKHAQICKGCDWGLQCVGVGGWVSGVGWGLTGVVATRTRHAPRPEGVVWYPGRFIWRGLEAAMGARISQPRQDLFPAVQFVPCKCAAAAVAY